jgi:hypothetical protein
MNKKILSLAIAAAVAAPMAAQADVKISGSVARDLYQQTTVNLVGGDSGTSKLNIDASEGDAFLRMAWDIRSAAYALGTAAGQGLGEMTAREQYAGIKLGGGKLMVGRQANLSSTVIYGADTLNATFLEARGKAGGTNKVASFDSGLLGYSMKAGDVDFALAYGPADKDMGANNNRVQAKVGFKAGPVDLAIGYDKDNAGSVDTTAVSGKMKFGEVKLNVLLEQDSSQSIVFADATMPLGGMDVNLGLGSNTTNSSTWTRVAVVKQMGKARVYAGADNQQGGTQRVGAGLRVDI